jgi:putative membrane-bound dehydrogenase-like protein
MVCLSVAAFAAGAASAADSELPAPADQAAAKMTLPAGFKATLFAGEPDVAKPIACCFDGRGRLWVIESHSYPHWITDGKPGKDRVLIFEDRDGDGRFDRRTVFLDDGTNLSGIAVGHGGVWLTAVPNLLFVPVKPGEDRPAGPAKVLLDGWDLKAKHNVVNCLIWGPDGWLYGCNGILSNSRVGKPGTPDAERTAFNCGVWRYHPVRHVFEPVAWGTTNPWGLDFDDHGEMFITNCVIKHIFHVVPGAHFQRMYGSDLNPYSYGLVESCADHIHWAGGHWTDSRGGKAEHSDAGGGHAHSGAMVYLGDNFPAEYRNRVLMCNIHGSRVNADRLERRGSTYVARHAEDFLHANDPWFRGLAVHLAPDGGVIVTDWCDTGECHNYEKVTRGVGRIYKVVHGAPKPTGAFDLAAMSDAELVALQGHRNDWWVRRARLELHERAAAGRLAADTIAALPAMFAKAPDAAGKLRALWALHVAGGLSEKELLDLTGDAEPAVRGWAVRLLGDGGMVPDAAAGRLADLAKAEPAASVRLAIASVAQRVRPRKRMPIVAALAAHAEDAADPYLPLMVWYAAEPLVPRDPELAAAAAGAAKLPIVRRYIARRIAVAAVGAPDAKALDPLVKLLSGAADDAVRYDVMEGMAEAFVGRRTMPLPAGWAEARRRLAASPDGRVRSAATRLSVLFGDPEALAELRALAADGQADADARRTALETLMQRRPPELPALLRSLLDDPAVRGPAIRGLAAFDGSDVPELLLSRYAQLTAAERADAVGVLTARTAWASALLDALEKNRVPRTDVSAFAARQIAGFNDAALTEKLTAVWGPVRATPKDKAAQLARYLRLVTPDRLAAADRSAGRAVFQQHCASCHTLWDAGGRIGPELTGSQRANPEYLLSEMLDPNAVVGREYQVTVFKTADERIINGIVRAETDKAVTIQTPTELITLPAEEIAARQKSALSMMPEGLPAKMTEKELRDLIAYMAGREQVPAKAGGPEEGRRR